MINNGMRPVHPGEVLDLIRGTQSLILEELRVVSPELSRVSSELQLEIFVKGRP